MHPYIPDSRAKYVRINEEYTYSLDGRVGILRKGSWLPRAEWNKAWVAAADEIERLRKRVDELEARQG